jgi:hypothetical protein
MIVWVVLITAISLLMPSNKVFQTYLGLCACIIFSSLVGLRSFDSGTDTFAYVLYFNSMGENTLEFEPLFYYFTLFFATVSSSVTYIFSLSAIPIFLVFFAALSTKVKRPALIICLFISFVPGIDLITNGVRSGLSLSIGLFLVVMFAQHPMKRYVFNFVPVFFHYSFIMVLLADIGSKILSLRMLTIINMFGILVIFFWLSVNAEALVTYVTDFYWSQDEESSFVVDKLLRYLINKQTFFSKSVFMYFAFLSIFLTLANFYFLRVRKVVSDRISICLYSLSTLLFFAFALVSFSPFSYRFMFVAYVFQVFLFGYLMDHRGYGDWVKLMYFCVICVSSLITYTTNTMSRFTFLDIF